MRVRSKSFVPHVENYVQYRDGTTIVQNLPCKLFDGSESIEDVLTTDFEKKRNSGMIINSPCALSRLTRTCGGGYYWARLKTAPNTTYESAGSGSLTYARINLAVNPAYWDRSPVGFVDVQGDAMAAQLSAMQKIDHSTYNFAEDVFEFRQVLSFLKKPFASLSKLTLEFNKSVKAVLKKRGRTSSPGYHAKVIADAWTEYRFAITPLVKSSLNIVWYLNSGIKLSPPVRRTAHGVVNAGSMANDEYWIGIHKFSGKKTTVVTTHAYILYEIKNPLVTGFRHDFGLSPLDIPEAIWAVVPYSFMVDRLVDISGYIRALTNILSPNVEILTSGYSITKNVETKNVYLMQNSPTYDFNIVGDEAVSNVFTYDRFPTTLTTASVLPQVNLTGLIRDATRLMDLAALILQRVRP